MAARNHRIALIADTTCDVPADLIEHYGIYLLSQYIIWGTEELADGVDITPSAFIERLVRDPVAPKTAQPTASDFVRVIEKAKQAGAEEAVLILISSQMSGTINSAISAQGMVDIPLHIVDSKSISMGIGWQVLAAARAREAGGDAQAMVAAAEKARSTMTVMFVVETLEYLHRGGRIGGASKLVGTALQIKPQLYVDHTTGLIMPGERARTMTKAVERMYQSFIEKMDTSKPMHIAVQHVGARASAEAFADRLRREFPSAEILVGDASPVIGTHCGPGTFGPCGYYEA
jgi:DegV family protein with EDD domain